MRLLITRPEEDARPLADALAGRGVETVTAPLLSIEIDSGPPLDMTGVAGVLITSANGARALAARTNRRDLPAYAVGDASARQARAEGFTDVHSAGGDVDDLARVVAETADPAAGALLHAAGSRVAGDLKGLLEARGFACRRAVLYRAETARALPAAACAALADGSVDGVLFFSPRTAATFVRLVEAAGLASACVALTAYCLSDAVAEQAGALPWRRAVVAARPDQASLIAAIDP